jgi:hypothetical protein
MENEHLFVIRKKFFSYKMDLFPNEQNFETSLDKNFITA